MFYFPQRIAKLFWKNGGMEKNNIPFSIVETKQLDCHFGPHYYQECKPKSHRVFLQGTRKIGCNARIIIKKCKLFPEFEALPTEKSTSAYSTIMEISIKKLKQKLTSLLAVPQTQEIVCTSL